MSSKRINVLASQGIFDKLNCETFCFSRIVSRDYYTICRHDCLAFVQFSWPMIHELATHMSCLLIIISSAFSWQQVQLHNEGRSKIHVINLSLQLWICEGSESHAAPSHRLQFVVRLQPEEIPWQCENLCQPSDLHGSHRPSCIGFAVN